MARAWSARAARLLVALALVTAVGGAREPRAGSRLAPPLGARGPLAPDRRHSAVRSGGPPRARAEASSALGLAYSSEESERFVFLAGAAYCDAGLESWTCPYCNGTDLVDVRVTKGARNVRGYVGWDVRRDVAVVAFRGTEPNSLENWLENLDAHHSEWELFPEPGEVVPPPPVRVHAGFLDSWRELRGDTFAALADIANARFSRNGKNKDARLPVVVTGHSLGGALATLAAFELAASGYDAVPLPPRETNAAAERLMAGGAASAPPPPPPPPRARALVQGVRTFGSPRVGDILFAAAYRAVLGDRTWRVTHAHDVVPSVPVRLMGFHHVPTEVFYPGGDPGGSGSGNDTAPVVCDGGGEDAACSDGEWTHTSVMDHLYYLDTYICGCNS
jgi:hypothetical protein